MLPKGQSALVVEDDHDISELLTDILSNDLGIRPTAVASGKVAIQVLSQVRYEELPDVIIIDIGLQDLPGWKVLDFIRLSERLSGIPVIVTTGHADDTTKNRALAEGATEFLAKPFRLQGFIECVQRVLQKE